MIADRCLRESTGRGLRPDEEVHHSNFIRSCNHDFNLIIMSEALHHGISGNRPGRRGRYYGREGARLQERRPSDTC
jgi:hypothetical protein